MTTATTAAEPTTQASPADHRPRRLSSQLELATRAELDATPLAELLRAIDDIKAGTAEVQARLVMVGCDSDPESEAKRRRYKAAILYKQAAATRINGAIKARSAEVRAESNWIGPQAFGKLLGEINIFLDDDSRLTADEFHACLVAAGLGVKGLTKA